MHSTTNDPQPRTRAYTLAQTAVALGISRRLLERLCATGQIRSVLASPRRRLVPAAEIDRFLGLATDNEQERA
jgi:predicted site-specific integrase-resolvase